MACLQQIHIPTQKLSGGRWTIAEQHRAVALASSGTMHRDIARIMGRSIDSVGRMLRKHGVKADRSASPRQACREDRWQDDAVIGSQALGAAVRAYLARVGV